MSDTASSNTPQERVGKLMKGVTEDIKKVSFGDPQVQELLQDYAKRAANWLVNGHPHREVDEMLVSTLSGWLPRLKTWSLASGKVSVFFSYKAEDAPIAEKIGRRLERWSGSKLLIRHMGLVHVGCDWRAQIEAMIPQCDWFLLLLPTPGDERDWLDEADHPGSLSMKKRPSKDERDWVLYEAGYFSGGEGLAGRMVCLHHPDNEVTSALKARQSVPADVVPVRAFLKELFCDENWLPGLPALNQGLSDQLDGMAAEIVNEIKPPAQTTRFCCGPHMEVRFKDASAVRGWEQLKSGSVIEDNPACRDLFNLDPNALKPLFSDWVGELLEGEQDTEWITQLASAVQAAVAGKSVPRIDASFRAPSGQLVQPRISAVRRSNTDRSVKSIHILFNDAELPPPTNSMKPDLAALAIALEYAVRYRYQLLEPFAGRKLGLKDAVDFQSRRQALQDSALNDRRLENRSTIRERILRMFDGGDKAVIQGMFERRDQLWPQDQDGQGKGEMSCAINNAINGDTEALEGLIKELVDMLQSFLTVTSKRFAELLAGS